MKNKNRMYKNELLQESFQNKVGLTSKPSINELMIGDFIREQSNKNLNINSYGN